MNFVLAEHTSYMSTQHIQNNLITGQQYRFWVLARNDAGYSERSEIITLLAATVSSAPQNLYTVY